MKCYTKIQAMLLRWLTSTNQCVTVFSLVELLHSRWHIIDPKPEQKSACCCNSAPLCHSCSRNRSFSCTHTGPCTHCIQTHQFIRTLICRNLTSLSFWHLACTATSWLSRWRHFWRNRSCSCMQCSFPLHQKQKNCFTAQLIMAMPFIFSKDGYAV